jgi:hypothetical protein
MSFTLGNGLKLLFGGGIQDGCNQPRPDPGSDTLRKWPAYYGGFVALRLAAPAAAATPRT